MCARHHGFPNIVFLSMQDNREKFIQRLNEDLIGPFFGDDEVLLRSLRTTPNGYTLRKSEQIPMKKLRKGITLTEKRTMATKTPITATAA